jgi:hypothetical protein
LRRVRKRGFRYVVVDEIVGRSVGLAVSDWPTVDDAGRVRFTAAPALVGADAAELQQFLNEHRRPTELAERPLRIGDAFAVRVRPAMAAELDGAHEEESRHEPTLDLDSIEPPVYDVTADARDAAKTSFFSSVTPTLSPAQASALKPLTDPPPAPRPLRARLRTLRPSLGTTTLVGAVTIVFASGLLGGTAVGRALAPTKTSTLAGATTTLPPFTTTELSTSVTTETTATTISTTISTAIGEGSYVVNLTIAGTGSVTSDPAGIDCSATPPPEPAAIAPPPTLPTTRCAPAEFPFGTPVVLTAEPASDFSRWEQIGRAEDTRSCLDKPTCQVTLDRQVSFLAVFGSGGPD